MTVLMSFLRYVIFAMVMTSLMMTSPVDTIMMTSRASYDDPPALVADGHVIIGVLTTLLDNVSPNHTASLSQDVLRSDKCQGSIPTWALQEVASLEWALNTINNQSDKDFTVGLKVYDNCGDQDRMVRQAAQLLRESEEEEVPLLGVISMGAPALLDSTAAFFHAFSVPIIATRTPHNSRASHSAWSNVFTTAPHIHAQIQASLSLVTHLSHRPTLMAVEHRLGVISETDNNLQLLLKKARKQAIEIDDTFLFSRLDDGFDVANETLGFLRKKLGYQSTMMLLLRASTINQLMDSPLLTSEIIQRVDSRWIFVVIGGEMSKDEIDGKKMNRLIPGSFIVEPHAPMLPGLKQHLDLALQGSSPLVAPLLASLKKEPCEENPHLSCRHVVRGSVATAAVKAVASMEAAFKMIMIEKCPKDGSCKEALTGDVHKAMLSSMMKLSYNGDGVRYTAEGKLVSAFVIAKATEDGTVQVGQYREDTGLVWTRPIQDGTKRREYYNRRPIVHSNEQDLQRLTEEENDPEEDRDGRKLPYEYLNGERNEHDGILKEIMLSHHDVMGKAFAVTILALSTLGILSTLYVGVYVGIRYCDGTIQGPQVLGILLLVGVTCIYASCIIYILPPTTLTCHIRIWLPNLALALCFSILLVKAMQLRAIVRLGLGGEIPLVNYYLSLIFMLGLQGVICFLCTGEFVYTWWSSGMGYPSEEHKPIVQLDSDGLRQCRREKMSTLLTQDYLLVLLLMGIVMGVSNRGIRRNHNEGRHLLVVSSICTPIIVCWALTVFLLPNHLYIMAGCMAHLSIAATILLFIFVPKLRVIAKQQHEFSHKPLNNAPSLSTIFTYMENPPPLHPHALPSTLQPPPPFCDTPRKIHRSSTMPSPYPSHHSSEVNTVRSWLDLNDSPRFQRIVTIPPPPPPPMRNPIYYQAGNCYP